MADEYTHTGLKVVGRHTPDDWDGVGDNPHDVDDPTTGWYDVGVIVEGVLVPIARRKAAGLFADIARAKATADKAAPSDG